MENGIITSFMGCELELLPARIDKPEWTIGRVYDSGIYEDRFETCIDTQSWPAVYLPAEIHAGLAAIVHNGHKIQMDTKDCVRSWIWCVMDERRMLNELCFACYGGDKAIMPMCQFCTVNCINKGQKIEEEASNGK